MHDFLFFTYKKWVIIRSGWGMPETDKDFPQNLFADLFFLSSM